MTLHLVRDPKPTTVPAIVHERVTFTARCPRCGHDTEWTDVREDTRVWVVVNCCGGAA